MKESSIQILLAEYDRLKGMEQYWLNLYQRGIQLYLTIATAAVGLFLLIAEGQSSLMPLRSQVGLILGTVLIIGEIIFLWLLRVDVGLLTTAKAYQKIRDQFQGEDNELSDAFPKSIIHESSRYRHWSSIRGIMERVFTVSQYKTMVVVLNSLAYVALLLIIIWPRSVWGNVGIGIVTILISGFLHVVYSSRRYKREDTIISKGNTTFWI